MMRCEEMAGIIGRWQQGESLASEELLDAREHLESCRACRRSYRTLLPLMMRDGGGRDDALPPPGLEERVMRVVLASGPPRVERPVRRGRLIAVAAAVVLLAISGTMLLRAGLDARAGLTTVAFVLDAPGAHSVALVGDFTGWQAKGYELAWRSSDGKWAITLRLKADRTYVYSFLVDGKVWTPDPVAGSVDDGFGGSDSLLRL